MGRVFELIIWKIGINFFIKNFFEINLKNRLKYILGYFKLIVLFCFFVINRFGCCVFYLVIMVIGGLFCFFVLVVFEGN